MGPLQANPQDLLEDNRVGSQKETQQEALGQKVRQLLRALWYGPCLTPGPPGGHQVQDHPPNPDRQVQVRDMVLLPLPDLLPQHRLPVLMRVLPEFLRAGEVAEEAQLELPAVPPARRRDLQGLVIQDRSVRSGWVQEPRLLREPGFPVKVVPGPQEPGVGHEHLPVLHPMRDRGQRVPHNGLLLQAQGLQ